MLSIFSSTIINKVFSFFLILNISINCLIPKFTIYSKPFEFHKVIENQTIIARFFFHTTLPIKILNSILRDTLCPNSLTNTAKNSGSNNNTEENANSSNEYAIINLQNLSFNKNALNETNKNPLLLYNSSNRMDYYQSAKHGGFQHNLFLCFIILLFFFMLPRSSITVDKAIKYIQALIRKPNLKYSNWVFYFVKNFNIKF